MRIAILVIGFAVVMNTPESFAQPAIATGGNKDTEARALFFDARARANSGDHAGAVRLIDRAIGVLGERKRRMMPVLIDSLRQLHRYARAATEATTYLAMKPAIKSREYKRIAALLPLLRTKAAEHKLQQERARQKRERVRRRADEAAWQQALRQNASHSYRYYLQRYPNGLHAAQARIKIDEAKRREDKAQLDRQRQQRLQREKYEKQRRENQLRNNYVREMRKEAKAIKSSSSMYFTGGILAIIGGGAAAVLMDDDTPRTIGGIAVVGGAVLLYLGQSKINASKRMMRDAEDIQRKRKPLPPDVRVSPWLGPKRSYGLALGGRF